MTNDEALTLEALKYAASMGHGRMAREMKIAPFTIKEAQAQPVQEPVAWRLSNEAFDYQITSYDKEQANTYIKNGWHLIDVLYTSPPKRPWVGLTDEDIAYAYTLEKKFAMQYVDAKLKEKNT